MDTPALPSPKNAAGVYYHLVQDHIGWEHATHGSHLIGAHVRAHGEDEAHPAEAGLTHHHDGPLMIRRGLFGRGAESGKDWAERQRVEAERATGGVNQICNGGRVKAPISVVGVQSAAGLACPGCGGTQFKARRSKAARYVGGATLGVGALLIKQSQVTCVTCGTRYARG